MRTVCLVGSPFWHRRSSFWHRRSPSRPEPPAAGRSRAARPAANRLLSLVTLLIYILTPDRPPLLAAEMCYSSSVNENVRFRLFFAIFAVAAAGGPALRLGPGADGSGRRPQKLKTKEIPSEKKQFAKFSDNFFFRNFCEVSDDARPNGRRHQLAYQILL